MEVTEKDECCWTCDYQWNWGETTFLGKCTAPAANNPTGKKDIPPEIVDKGCKRWKAREKKA